MGRTALISSINHELSQLQLHNTETGFICRVIESLRNVNSQSYEPDILAIGPYHHGKDKYKMMEKHKLRYMQSILNRRKEATAERYILVVSELEERARSCYAEPIINLDQDNFIKMLVLDGCFIIELALKFHKLFHNSGHTYSNDPIFTEGSSILSRWMRDLILFENQIPFFILRKLFDLIEGPNKHDRLMELLLNFCGNLFPDRSYRIRRNTGSDPSDVKHLLELIYNWWTPESFDGSVDPNKDYPNSESRYIHSAAELKDAKVKLKKREHCDFLFEVKFENGTLLIPPLIISEDTESFFRNLIAYEQYIGYDGKNYYVAAYLHFMNLLINSSKDVDVLVHSGIINNMLGDNEVIACIFNKLMDSVVCFSRRLC